MSTEAILAPAAFYPYGRTVNLHRLHDEDLVRLAQKGSAPAMERLICIYGPLVRTLSNKFFLVGAEREDVIQEGFVGLYKAIRSYCQTEKTAFKCFAILCITRQIQSAVRDSRRAKHEALSQAAGFQISDAGDPFIEPAVEQTDTLGELISEYCSGLTEFERTVLREMVLGKSYSDIGKLLGCPIKSVDNGIQRAKRKIISNRSG